jgi:mono/diheme cytochrome c family protein
MQLILFSLYLRSITMRASYFCKVFALAASVSLVGDNMGSALATEPPTFLAQGANWTSDVRAEYYSLDQGSRLIPLTWIRALRKEDGAPFMADSLSRYGFLPLQDGASDLPIGFTTAGVPGAESLGMSCAACHTRKIEAQGKAYIIDGGPSLTDLQAMLADLDAAVEKALADEAAFAGFAQAVLGHENTPSRAAALKVEVTRWHLPFKTLVRRSLPQEPWGLGRADAVGMIFNRLTGLNIGTAPDRIIVANIHTADAPVRYPFLWNAGNQDKTQWAGFADNRDEADALVRNVGQVLGVFADFYPEKTPTPGVNYWANNSVAPFNLFLLDAYMKMIEAPRWPWGLNEALAQDGEEIFGTVCANCHADSGDLPWLTTVKNVGTDTRHLDLLDREAETGILRLQRIDPSAGEVPEEFQSPLAANDKALRILAIGATNSLIQFRDQSPRIPDAPQRPNGDPLGANADFESTLRNLKNVIRIDKPGYEARVLHGIWAAAPYLHNGSVPNLAELLKPPAERKAAFKVGTAYDPVAVGLAEDQPGLHSVMTTTDCSASNSGNSRCGHEFGTDLSEGEKRALLEYLKKL